MILYLEEESDSILGWPEIMYLAKLISDIFWSFNIGCDPRNRIWNEPVCLAILSEYISIYLKLESEDYKIENKMHVDTKYEWGKMAAALILTYLITKSYGRWELGFTNMSSAAQFIFRKWCLV